MVARTALLAAALAVVPVVLSAQSSQYPFRRFGTFREYGPHYRDMARDMANRFRNFRVEPFRFQSRINTRAFDNQLRIQERVRERLLDRQNRAFDLRMRMQDRQFDLHNRMQERLQNRLRDRVRIQPFRYHWRNGRI